MTIEQLKLEIEKAGLLIGEIFLAFLTGMHEVHETNTTQQELIEGLQKQVDELKAAGPTDPAPIDPAPIDPAPIDPAPIDPEPIDPAPIDPEPIDPPKAYTIEIVANEYTIAGEETEFEAKIDDSSDVESVKFYVNGVLENVEKNEPFNSWPDTPLGDFELKAEFIFKDGTTQEAKETFTGQPRAIDPEPKTDTGQFAEIEDGLFMLEAQTISGKGWEKESDVTGYASEAGYITFRGSNSYQEQKEETTVEAKVTVDKAGKYHICAFNYIGSETDASQKNDSWISMDADAFYAEKSGQKVYAKGSGKEPTTQSNDSSNGFLKFYSNALKTWSTQTSAVDNNPHGIYAELEAGKEYTFRLAGRSEGHSVDRVFLKHAATPAAKMAPYLEAATEPEPIDPEPIDPTPIDPEPIDPTPIEPGTISSSFDFPPENFFEDAKAGLVTSWQLDVTSIAEGGVTKEQLVSATGGVFDDIKMHGDEYIAQAYGDKLTDPKTGKNHGIWKIKETVKVATENGTVDRVDEYLKIADPALPDSIDSWQDKYQFKASKGQLNAVMGDLAFTRRVVRFPSADPLFGGFEPGHGKIFSGVKTTQGTPTPPGNNTKYGPGYGEYSCSVYDGTSQEFRKGDYYGSKRAADHKDSDITIGMAFYGTDKRMVSEGFHAYQHEMFYCDLPTNIRHRIQLDKWIEMEEVVIRNTPGKSDAVIAARLRYEGETDWRYMRYINDFDWLGDDSSNPAKLLAGGLIFYYGGAPQNKTNRSVHLKEISIALK